MKEYGIKLGTILFTMVEPHKGHEVEYNRWYERDHYYAGVMIAPFTLAGSRWVATREEKALRAPTGKTVMSPDADTGTYLAVYSIEDGHHDEWNRWSVDQVHVLHATGRMFPERDHVHTLLYNYEWCTQRDENGVSPELAFDHRFPGMVVVAGRVAEGSTLVEAEAWLRETYLPTVVKEGSPVALVLHLSPIPLLEDAPGDVVRVDAGSDRFIQLWFTDAPATEVWSDVLGGVPEALDASGVITSQWISPFRPTIIGTDTYTDQLW